MSERPDGPASSRTGRPCLPMSRFAKVPLHPRRGRARWARSRNRTAATLKDLYLGESAAEVRKEEARELALLGPDRAPALRPRAAPQRRVLAARGLPRAGRLRRRAGRDAPHRRHALADAHHARRDAEFAESRQRGRHASRCATPRACSSPPWTSRTSGPRTSRPRPRRSSAPTDDAHPGVDQLLNRTNAVYLGGRLEGVEPPTHYDFKLLRRLADRAARAIPQAGLAQGRGLPDPQPDAPRPPRADLPRGRGARGQPAHPPRGRA